MQVNTLITVAAAWREREMGEGDRILLLKDKISVLLPLVKQAVVPFVLTPK